MLLTNLRPLYIYVYNIPLLYRERESMGEELAASLAEQTPDNGIEIHVHTLTHVQNIILC